MKILIRLVILVLVVFAGASVQAQTKNQKKGTFYLALGSHRIFYTPSDIRVIRGTSPSFDFTLENVKAKDEGGLRWKTAPEFSYTVGYYFTRKNFGIEYQYDHIKYFVTPNQRVHMNGTINGERLNKDTVLSADFFRMEHSDGGNYAMVNLVKWWPLMETKSGKPFIDLMAKAGIGIVNPKTNTTILGHHRDDKYHFSGYVMGAESGLRVHFLKHFFVTGSFKGAFANYNHFLIDEGFGQHKIFSGAFNYLVGGQFGL
jgi:hypothetical protein